MKILVKEETLFAAVFVTPKTLLFQCRGPRRRQRVE
jgi:hypothetical protein